MAALETLPFIIDNKPVRPSDAQVGTHSSNKTKAEYVKYLSATPAIAHEAAESSRRAFVSWSQSLPRDREAILRRTATLLRENADEMVKIQVEETNCPELWARTNVEWAALHLNEIAGRITSVMTGDLPVVQTPGQIALVNKKPVGPVLSIPPWNGAVILACRSINTPIAVGCTVVLKVSEQSPRTHHFLAGLFHKAGLPPGVLNVLQCRREEAAATTEALIAHRHIRKVEFIGSATIGRQIAATAGKHLKPTVMELGGKAAAIVLDDADLHLAAQAVVTGGFIHHGQVCFATEKVIVHASIVDNFIPILQEKAKAHPTYGAIGTSGPERTLRLVKAAMKEGAELLYGEAKLIDSSKMHPVILKGLTSDMEIDDEESFGPVLAVYIVHSDQEAIDLANSSKYGLSGAVFSKDIGRGMAVANLLEVGQSYVNYPLGTGKDEATVPIGLTKASGWGVQNGSYGMQQFLEFRTLTVTNPVEFASGKRELNPSPM